MLEEAFPDGIKGYPGPFKLAPKATMYWPGHEGYPDYPPDEDPPDFGG